MSDIAAMEIKDKLKTNGNTAIKDIIADSKCYNSLGQDAIYIGCEEMHDSTFVLTFEQFGVKSWVDTEERGIILGSGSIDMLLDMKRQIGLGKVLRLTNSYALDHVQSTRLLMATILARIGSTNYTNHDSLECRIFYSAAGEAERVGAIDMHEVQSYYDAHSGYTFDPELLKKFSVN